MTINDILHALPRSTRRQVERILQKPQDVRLAAKQLEPILAPHAQVLKRLGLEWRFACYALPFYAQNPGGDISDYVRQVEAEAEALAAKAAKLESQVKALQRIVDSNPASN